MYAIIINNIECEFDGKVSMIENNPISSDEISGYSLQFSFSAESEINRRAHGYIDLPSITSNEEKELSCVILAGSKQLVGTVISKYQNGSFVDYFKNSGDFYGRIKDKNLSDIPFDKVSLETLSYEDLQEVFDSYHHQGLNQPFSFPRVIYNNPGSKMPVKIDFALKANVIPEVVGYTHIPIIPFLHLHYIFASLFEKHGVEITDNAFDRYTFLKRLCFASNFLLQEFSVDTAVNAQQLMQVAKVQNSKNPEVTTVTPHNLPNHALIHLKNTIASVSSRIFQIEVKDALTFTLIDEDFSALPELILNYKVTAVDFELVGGQATYILTLDADIVQIDQFNTGTAWFRVTTSYVAPENALLQTVYDEESVLQLNQMRFMGSGTDDLSSVFENASLYFLSKGGVAPSDQIGIIETLNPIRAEFKTIDPANHVPDMKIADLLVDMEKLGIYTFINSNKAEIHLIKDILNSAESINISDIAGEIRDIENPGLNGYALKMTVDSSDEFAKKMQPVTELDEKYTLKAPVTYFSQLVYAGSETNDVRLVTYENAFYVFNKSFLNAENNWKFLCYNNLDKKEGNGDFEVTTKFSSVITDRELNVEPVDAIALGRLDVACNCKTFTDSSIKLNPRLLLFYNLVSPDGSIPYATSDIYNHYYFDSFGAEMAIRWHGEKSIYEVMLKEYVHWQTKVRKDCVATIHWPGDLFANFKFHKKYHIKGVEYLVKSIKYDIDFKEKQIVFGDTELAKV